MEEEISSICSSLSDIDSTAGAAERQTSLSPRPSKVAVVQKESPKRPRREPGEGQVEREGDEV